MSEAPKDALDPGTQEDRALEHLGYQQEFKRSFSLLDMVGFSFSIVTCWTALSGAFSVGVSAGGPPVMLFGWIGVCVVTFAVVLAMAEWCSRWPVAGGQYSWVFMLAPPKIAREMSYITGWFMLTGILAMGSANNSFAANFILGQANLVHPDYVIERWHTVLVTYAVAIWAFLVNIFMPHLLNRLSRAILLWNVCSFIIIVVVLLVTKKDKQDAAFVFQDFQNMTGFGSAMATMVGILQSFFGMCCYDTPAHMTEEMTRPSRDAPLAMIMSVGMGAVTGFVFLLTLCFCIGDITATADSSTGVPVIQIFYDSTQSKVGTCFMASMIAVIMMVSSVSLVAEGSRSLFAFARDRGMPFSGILSRVAKGRRIPIYAILVTVVIQMAFNSIYFGTVTGFNTVVSIATTGFYVSYALVLFARLLGWVFNHDVASSDGPYSFSKPISLSLHALGFLFLFFAFITFNFPSDAPVTPNSMNYTSAAIGLVALLSIFTWLTTARKQFKGPSDVQELVVDGVEDPAAATVSSAGGSEKVVESSS
ncbi:GABA permease [Aspergillus heteromorphus CBS 117.55]|uniref:GABA permease n=1 Tax=Aspergillus heteromorphus CBS 117.55 TaxID=1448321 RepID=A0A317VLI7_9EURO|nr:GABA permease [Aspergillus heteromorphus CBS 117.55]PWY73732.1 GABA permease [Aspergillus heteromorphus CBS 117.55]